MGVGQAVQQAQQPQAGKQQAQQNARQQQLAGCAGKAPQQQPGQQVEHATQAGAYLGVLGFTPQAKSLGLAGVC